MAGLTRYTQSLFASSGLTPTAGFGAAANGTTTTENGSSNTPSNIMTGTAGAWSGGWLSAVLGASKFPAIEDMNAVFYALSYQLAYLLERGLPEYDSGTTYNQFDIARNPSSYQLFGSLINTNLGNALPTAPNSNANWQYLGDLSSLAAQYFFTGGTSTGSANAQVVSTLTPSGFSLSNNGATVVCTAGFTNTGSTTFNLGGTGATTVKKNSGSGLVNLAGGEIVANETIFLTVNTASSCLVLTDGPALGALATLNVGTNLTSSGGNLNVSTPNYHQQNPADPTGTTSLTGVMMGLAGSLTTAGNGSGVVKIVISGSIDSSSSSNDGAFIQIRYGTGSAPTNGAALTGTALGSGQTFMDDSTGGIGPVPFCTTYILSGLAASTAYWFDLSLAAINVGTASISKVSISLHEIK